jgi:hypothetical protein
MKADLNSLKKELGRFADIDYLKKELGRVATEVKKFDFQSHLTPQAKKRLQTLEQRFNEILKAITSLEKRVESNLTKFMRVVRSKTSEAQKVAKKSVKSAKSAGKSAARKKTVKK